MADDRVGQRVGKRYVIEGILGVGAFGTVYEALHENTGQRVALKLLHLPPSIPRNAISSPSASAGSASSAPS